MARAKEDRPTGDISGFRSDRRKLLLAGGAAVSPAWALGFPNRPLRWIVGDSPGAGVDSLARTIATGLSSQLGQQVVVDNRAGASGMVAAEAVSRSARDGYTILTADNAILVYNLARYSKVPYDAGEFAPVGLIGRAPIVLLSHPSARYTNAKDVLDAMHRKPGEISYASPGVGSPHSVGMDILKTKAKVVASPVQYLGAGPAIEDVLDSQLSLILLDLASAMPLLKAGRLKPLGVFSRNRHPLLPGVQTFFEIGATDFEASLWQGIVVPKGSPVESKQRLEDALATTLRMVAANLRESGWDLTGSSGAPDMQKLWDAEAASWKKLLRERKISVE